LGVTAVIWEQFSGAGQITAGAGLYKSGNTLSVGTASASRIVVGTDDIDLATTGVTASTYKSVTVDAYGRVTAGTNPTTLAGFGITDAYTQAQVDAALALKLNLTGGTMSGAIAMGTNKITGLGDPTLAQDAATKNYIDTIFGSTTTAAASAAAAAASATNAQTYSSAASTSASAAAASATSAANSFDSFDDRYLGAKSSDPTVDNDGNALITGALYFNSVANEMRVYNGSAWLASYIPATGYAQLAATNTFTANQIINVADNTNAALKVTQTGTGLAMLVEDAASDTTPFVISATGVVGIGTATPEDVTSSGIALVTTGSYYPQIVNRNKSNDGTASYFVFDKDRAGAVVQNGDVLGNMIFRGYDGASYLQAAAIMSYVNGTPGTNDMPGSLAFLTTADGASSPAEQMRLTSTGLGIGTSSPAKKLDVRVTGTGNVANFQSDAGPNLSFTGTESSGRTYAIGEGLVTAGSFSVYDSTAGAERLVINSSGVLGLKATPSTWTGINAAMDFGGSVAVANTYGGGATIAYNCWQNGSTATWYYKNSALATIYEQVGGAHYWKNGASGTAGNAITFTQVMTIDASGVISDQNGKLRAIPQSGSAKTGSYTLATTDVGEFINVGSGGSITVPDATFATGDVVSIFNNTSGNVTLTMSITTAYIGGTDADKATITLATRGVATVLFISGTVCVVNGNVS
jgi:hypothetical protein